MSTQTNRQISREFLEEIWNRGNLDRIDRYVASGFVQHDPFAGRVEGIHGLKQFVAAFRDAFPDIRISVEDEIAEGDRVVTRWVSRGTHRGNLGGISPTNKEVATDGVSIVRFSDGKAHESWVIWDVQGLMTQLGVVPEPAEMHS